MISPQEKVLTYLNKSPEVSFSKETILEELFEKNRSQKEGLIHLLREMVYEEKIERSKVDGTILYQAIVKETKQYTDSEILLKLAEEYDDYERGTDSVSIRLEKINDRINPRSHKDGEQVQVP